ncbi:hypothetical protein, partial [Sulfurirhabdus autotrophica]
MNKRMGMILSVVVMASSISHQVNAECFDLKGKVLSSNINATTQLGTIELIGAGGELEGGILGQITNSNTSSLPIVTYLDHTVVFPGKGGFVTRNDVAQLEPVPNDACTFKAKEQLNIVMGTGKFSGASGTGTAIGTVNFCTGTNKFYL